jgi:hypothetical protein
MKQFFNPSLLVIAIMAVDLPCRDIVTLDSQIWLLDRFF